MGDYCRSHKIKLVKTDDSRIEVYVKHGQGYGHPWILLFNDISFIKHINQIKTMCSTAYNLPHNAIKIKSNKEFTSLNTLLYNNNITNWLKISYQIADYKSYIEVTTDHPLPTKNGEVKQAKELKVGDELIAVNNEQTTAIITNIELVEQCCRSYDVSTDTEYFNLSKNILSHNCRAFLSPWYEKGGMKPADENDAPVFVGRFNVGAVSLHLPMILAKARKENKDFYEVLDYYLQLIRKLHIRTYDYLGEMKASTNPLAYCEGGFYGGHLNYHDKIKPLLKSATASFGITALNELQRLYNGKSLVEDGQFAVEVMQYINKRVNEFKEEDGYLYALYGTPAESLCFAGDTVVQSYSGDKQIKDIKVGDLVYSLREDGRLDLNPVTDVKMTQKHAVVVKVVLDNKQEIICTPEHLFGVRKPTYKDGKFIGEKVHYIKAGDLKQGDRLKSNYRFLKCGHPAYSIYYNKNTQLEDDIVARYFYSEKQEGQAVDINKDKSDNTYPCCYTSESQSGTNNFYRKHNTAESNYRNTIGKGIEGENNSHTYKGLYWYDKDCELLEKNHKVVSVTVLPELIPVYSITVANNHNYFVGGSEGVLVHNCEKQVEQFRKLYGIIENVSDKLYVSNSFHCHVTENITPIEKQDLENRFWNLMNGGKIQYVKYPISYNTKAIETLVKRAMDLGFYEGVNLSLSYCDDCGYEQLDMDVCPKCGSRNLTKIDRMNGYLSYSRVKGDTRLNKGKMAEIHDRVSM